LPAHIVAIFGIPGIIFYLISIEQNLDSTDPWHGRALLLWAAGNGHRAVIYVPLETGKVNVDSKGNDSKTPLCWTARNGHEAVVNLLLKTGRVYIDSKDRRGRTPPFWQLGTGTRL
jgi:ankyrin repeat protein